MPVEAGLGFSCADAESVELGFDGSDLLLSLVDWREQPILRRFVDAIGFKWGQDFNGTPRDDQAFVIEESEWAVREASLVGVAVDEFTHYRLCFNAVGVLDVLARELESVAASVADSAR